MTDASGIVLDDAREGRIGFDEAILCEQKTVPQIAEIAFRSRDAVGRRFFTRLSAEKFAALPPDLRDAMTYDAQSRTAVLGAAVHDTGPARIALVSAGSSDASVVSEAQATLAYYGQATKRIEDVGVAGIWRLLARVDEIGEMPVVIAVAGMDAALPTVLSGLVPSFVIGVPTSTGYGAARNGETALSAMLASCAPGLTVVNIDNGYGAACAAMRFLRMSGKVASVT